MVVLGFGRGRQKALCKERLDNKTAHGLIHQANAGTEIVITTHLFIRRVFVSVPNIIIMKTKGEVPRASQVGLIFQKATRHPAPHVVKLLVHLEGIALLIAVVRPHIVQIFGFCINGIAQNINGVEPRHPLAENG